ncbi:UDP-N-acetylglucosamine-transferase [bacterium]|nr:UDP-N-acetylglucosamine-transferase [bacterium]
MINIYLHVNMVMVGCNSSTILLHLPAYRDPELIPTIEDALNMAEFPERIHFGIFRQYNPDDGFDDLSKYKSDPRFKIEEINYTKAKGLPYARALINEQLLTDEDYVCQLDSHHRFVKNWDTLLIDWHNQLVDDGYNPIIGGYSPLYNPSNDPQDRVKEPWMSHAACFYPSGTIFIRPGRVPNWQNLTKPYPARFLSGHFAFGTNRWAKEVRHDPNIFFAGEELNLSVRSFTYGYDLFHPHRIVIWHATMREERSGMLVWDDMSSRGDSKWWKGNVIARSRIRQLLEVEDNGHDLGEYTLGKVRTLSDYEKYAGINFKSKSFHEETIANLPPTPSTDGEWKVSYYHLVNITTKMLPGNDYTSILVSFDDANGNGVHQTYIKGDSLKQFLKSGKTINYEEMFVTNKKPIKVVYWAISAATGWAERVEFNL